MWDHQPRAGQRERHAPRPKCKSDLPWLVDVSESEFDDAVSTRVPVLVDLWAPWCGPCKMIAPGVEQAAREFAGRMKAVKVNVDEAPGVSARYRVQGIPTLLMLRDGELVDRQVGAVPPDRLVAWARQVVEADAGANA